MARAWIRLGDKTSHGGTVVQASAYTYSGGIQVARVGDMVQCPKKGHGTCPIVSGDSTLIIDGKPVARHGDKTSCGAMLIASQQNSTADQRTSVATEAVTGVQEASFEDFFSPYDEQADDQRRVYDQHFQLHDEHTGEPLVDRQYKIYAATGVTKGRTDAQGFTQKVSGYIAEEVRIEIFAEAA